MKNRHFIFVLLLASIFTWCTDPYEDEVFAAYDEEPIGLYLEANPEFANWVKLLKKADLFNAMNISIDYTCFVANNEAVLAYIKSKGWNSIDDLTEIEARNLMAYHILPGASYSYPGLSGKIPSKTVSGDFLTVTIAVEEEGDVRYLNDVRILRTDAFEKPLTNGIVHQLDEVLDPIIYTVWDLIEQNPEYTIFAKALEEAGLDAYLARRDVEVQEVLIRDYKTVFVVPNSVFQENGINDIDDLKQRFPGIPNDKSSEFYKFMAYHIIEKENDFGDLSTFPVGTETVEGVKGKNLQTLAYKEFISVADINNQIILNPSDQVLLTEYNIPGSNGYLHLVDNLLEISDPLRFGFEWEPTEWDEFRSIPFYRADKIKNVDPAEKFIFEEPTEHVRWKTIPAGGVTVYYESIDIDWDRFSYDDGLYADFTVNVGWIEFDTPVIMRGRYNIQMVKWNWYNAGALFQMYIDGEKFGAPISMTRDGNPTLNMGVYEFKESGEHVFRFRLVNIQNNLARFIIDRFIFTPVR